MFGIRAESESVRHAAESTDQGNYISGKETSQLCVFGCDYSSAMMPLLDLLPILMEMLSSDDDGFC